MLNAFFWEVPMIRGFWSAIIIFLIVLYGPSALYAQDDVWKTVGTSSWFSSANWTLGSPPTASQNAIVNNGGTAQLAGGRGTANNLTVADGSTVQVLPGGDLFTNSATAGPGGTLRFSGGFIAINVSRFQDNGLLLIDGNFIQTFTVGITGSGGLTTETTELTLGLNGSADTYSGPTLLSAGRLIAGSSTAFSPNSAFTVNGTLDLNGFSNTIGSLSGTGTVVNNGSGIARLTVGNDNTDTTFRGVIADGTSALALTKSGTGTLTLTNVNTYHGQTIVDAGNLIVDGSIASLETVVNAGASLGGHGTIGGNLVNSGIVTQFNSPGTLTVTGNYTQNAGGTLRIAIGGLGSKQHDSLIVNGHMTLGGTLQIVRLGNFNLQPGNQITFLTGNQGISGNFSTVQNDFSTGTVVGTVALQGNNIVLTASQASFTSIPTLTATPNLTAVAKALDSAIGDPRAAALIGFLNSQPVANLPHDLTLIAPSQISSTPATGQAVGKVQVSNIGQRLANIRAGSTGFSASGFAISGPAASVGEGFAGPTGSEGKGGSSVLAPSPGNRWGVFLTGLGEFTEVDDTPNAAGYNVDTGGFTLGVDYRLTPNFALGFTAGYAHTTVNLNGGGDIDVNGGKLGFYATAFANGFYLDTAVSGGPSGYNTHRTALQGTASGDTDGADFNFLVAAGYDWKKGDLTVGPTASFQFSYTSLDGFTETGSLAPLKFPQQNYESERSAFGAKAFYDWKIGHITVEPQVSAAWQHEYGSAAYTVVANFANGAGNSFTVSGPKIGRDSLLIGAGATVIWNDRVSTYLYYDGEVARTNYQSHNVSGGVRISF
jgi:autotransporter-associated beta strand protein